MTRPLTYLLVATFGVAAVVAASRLNGVGRDLAVPMAAALQGKSYAGTRPAPELPAGLDWINTGGEPLTLASLRGKVVLLDFWTYGCANCMHVIPDLERLERKYARELVVIGVHSAKFPNEGRTAQIRNIVQRYELAHPVVNDQYMKVWDAYGARAWPTLAIIDPAGNAVGQVAGEGHHDLLDEVIGSLVAEFAAKGALRPGPSPYRAEPTAATPLRFPGKVLADAAGRRLFIADTLNHRIVVADLDGKLLRTIGDGVAGLKDGPLASARFRAPQGLALAGPDTLYVADERNNAIRRVDLARGAVTTVAGTGAHGYLRGDAHAAREVALNTPWDLLWVGAERGGQLYVAMAGQHQLWRFDPATGRIARHAGSGYEALEDGPLLAGALNQPSGLATDGRVLFVADSEASAVRTAALDPDGALGTLVGTGLFDFGDVDGTGDAVRLQHVLGVAHHAGKVYLADTYNSKLKVLDPATRRVATLAGGFDEPGGLSVAGGKVYVADTNHHAIKVYDLATHRVTTLAIVGLAPVAR